jgi:hypothetical protein
MMCLGVGERASSLNLYVHPHITSHHILPSLPLPLNPGALKVGYPQMIPKRDKNKHLQQPMTRRTPYHIETVRSNRVDNEDELIQGGVGR